MSQGVQGNADVVVIGAGPVGLTLANELTRGGARVRVIDKAPGIREISKALIWHVRTQEVLDRVGIQARGEAEGVPLREVVVRAYGKRIGAWHLDGLDSPHPHPLIIGQNRTQHLLADLLAERGVGIEWGTEATALQHGADGVTLTLKRPDGSEEAVTSQYVVGCEGSNSLVRRTLGLTFEGERYSGEQFIQADCKIRWALPSGRSYLFLTDDGYMMVIEMPGDTVRIFISLPDKIPAQPAVTTNLGAAEDVSNAPTLDEIHDNFARLTGIECRLSDATWLARYRTSHRYANTFREGRCFVAGDAGHVHVPIGGQGMNTGIQDAFNLGWKMAGVIRGAYRPEILESYDAERHPVAEALIRGTDMAYKGILHPREIQQRAARLFGPYLLRMEPVQNLVRNTLEEMTISYQDSPLNRDCGGSSGPKPGERVRDGAAVRLSDLQTVRLRELTRAEAWTLLLFGGTTAQANYAGLSAAAARVADTHAGRVQPFVVAATTQAPAGLPSDVPTLLDGEQELHDRYGVTQSALYLLRPDDVVGFRGVASDIPALMEHLAAIFV